MPQVKANGIDIHYETTGDPADPPLLLVMGLGAQLIDWPAEFRDELAGRGFHVIAPDNRDAGLSTLLDDGASYLIADMAADMAALIEELGVGRAHVAGASMGGMIAQQLTIDRPDLVASLCSIMSTTGDRTVGRATPEAAAVLLRPPGSSRAEILAAGLATARVIGSPGYPATDEELRRKVTAKIDRSFRPQGTARQYAAILASPERTAGLGAVTAPTLVVHGADDPLIDVSGGRATAAAVPGAELLVLPGMGHDLPRVLWPQVIDAIVANAARA